MSTTGTREGRTNTVDIDQLFEMGSQEERIKPRQTTGSDFG